MKLNQRIENFLYEFYTRDKISYQNKSELYKELSQSIKELKIVEETSRSESGKLTHFVKNLNAYVKRGFSEKNEEILFRKLNVSGKNLLEDFRSIVGKSIEGSFGVRQDFEKNGFASYERYDHLVDRTREAVFEAFKKVMYEHEGVKKPELITQVQKTVGSVVTQIQKITEALSPESQKTK